MSTFPPYKSIVQEATIQNWEFRENSSKKYVVYQICLRNGDHVWTVSRRFSDFVKFDAIAKKLRSQLADVSLPSRFNFQCFGSDLAPDFIKTRQIGLGAYLDELIKTIGYGDTGFWHHPSVLTFFDISLSASEAFNDSPSSLVLNKIFTEASWEAEFQTASNLLEAANETNQSRLAFQQRGSNAMAYTKHLRRQLGGLRKKIEGLQAGLRNLEAEAILSSNLRIKKNALETLRSDAEILYDQLNGVDAQVASEIGPKSLDTTSSLPSPILSRPPATPSALPDDINDLLRHQAKVMGAQDDQLDNIYSAAQRQKNIALHIRQELEGQKKLLEHVDSQTESTHVKVKTGQRRVKKI